MLDDNVKITVGTFTCQKIYLSVMMIMLGTMMVASVVPGRIFVLFNRYGCPLIWSPNVLE